MSNMRKFISALKDLKGLIFLTVNSKILFIMAGKWRCRFQFDVLNLVFSIFLYRKLVAFHFNVYIFIVNIFLFIYFLSIFFLFVRIIDSWYDTDSNKCRFENPGENSDHMQIICGLFKEKRASPHYVTLLSSCFWLIWQDTELNQ